MKVSFALAVAAALFTGTAFATDAVVIKISMKDHVFTPSEIHVKANTPFTLKVTNNNDHEETFDSDDLGGQNIQAEDILIGVGKTKTIEADDGVKAGTYEFKSFIDENDLSTTGNGKIISE